MAEQGSAAALEFRVRYAETDQMGVVYHANYLVWCEMGRTELIRQRGASYAQLERDGLVLAVADATLRYHSPARYDDMIRVEATVDEVRSRTVRFGYVIYRVSDAGPNERLASASTTLIALDTDSRPRTLPRDLAERLRHG